jgi:phosphatidylglycerol:prolipoprotein diacylglycerol transferase
MPDGSLKTATLQEFHLALSNSADYFINTFGSITNVPYTHVKVPTGFPDWLFAMNFTHNVINEGIPISGCSGSYCSTLPVSVLPTSLYEAIICILLFVLLWAVRNKFNYGLHLFSLYLVLNGLERFFIEKIKVNYRYDWGFIHPAQSEIISVLLLFISSWILLFFRNRKYYLSDHD